MAPSSGKPEFSFRTRQKSWGDIKTQKHQIANIVIIGGGIVGAGILRELALQNIPQIYLFEKFDFASHSSGNSSKLIHAGLRYLEQSWIALKKGRLIDAFRQFRFVWAASRERKILGRLAPHLVKPKRIHFVLRADEKRWPLAVSFGIWTYYLMQLLQGQFFPRPTFAYSRSAREQIAPEMDHAKTSLVFSFWDSETDDARLVIENLQKANDLGAIALNYVEVAHYEREKDYLLVQLSNRETKEKIVIKTKILINASGAFVDEVRSKDAGPNTVPEKLLDRVAGSHLDVYPALTEKSYYVSATDERLVFLLKRHEDGLEYTRIGTTERPLKPAESSEFPKASKEEIDYLINLVRFFIPNVKLGPENIIRTDAGIRPLRAQFAERPFDKSREHAIIQEENVFHIVGVKLTDFRRVAAEVLRRLPLGSLGQYIRNPSLSKCHYYRQPPLKNAKLFEEDGMGEIIRRTMCLHWKDYLWRRRGLAPLVLQKLNPDLLKREFEVMAEIMGWDSVKQKEEWSA